MTIIRAEIRQWQLRQNVVEGKIYNDTGDIYDDGENIVVIGIKDIRESPTFFLIQTDHGIYKLDKEERNE